MGPKFYAGRKIATTSLLKKLALVFLSSVIYFGNLDAQTAATALQFDGVNDYVSVPTHPSLNISSNLTIEAWINYSGTSGVQDVVSKSSAAVNNSYIFPRTSDGWRTVEFLLNLNGQGWQTLTVTYSGSNNSKRNQWHHLAATYDGFFMRIYIDGVLKGTQAAAGTITVNNNPLVIGGQTGYEDEYYSGKLDDVRIWNRTLSGCEISSTMSCELDPTTQNGLAAYYKFNQGFVNLTNLLTPVLDATSNGNNGTLVNFLLTGLTSNWTTGTVTGTCGAFTPVTATAGAVATLLPVGSSIELLATGGDTYSWTGPNGFTSTQQNPVIPGAAQNRSGTYTVTATKNGCSASASVIITVAQRAKALVFDGTDDVIRIPNAAAFNSTSNLTLEMWVKPTSALPLVQNIVTKSSFNQNNGYIFPRTDDGWQSFSFWLAVNGQWRVVSAPYTNFNQWTHVAATYDGFFMRIYMNGTMVGSLSAPGSITVNTNDVSIGQQDGYNQEFYKGGLDELRFWNRALTQCELQNNQTCELNGANNGLATFSGLTAYYRFNQGLVDVDNSAYTVLADSSLNHNNGTLVNFSLSGAAGSNWSSGGNVNNSTCAAYTPNAAIATSNGPVVEVGTTVQLFASAGSSWSWTGPLGFTSTLQNPTISNSTTDRSGTYTVTITSNGCTANASTKLTVAYKAGSLKFDGVNDMVTVPASSSLNIRNTITLESWIYPTNNTRQIQDVVSKSSRETNTGYIFPRTDDGWRSYVFYLHINGAWQSLSAPYPGINQWHHVAATYDGYYMRIYLDGVLSASKEAAGSITTNNNPLTIGQQIGFNEPQEEYFRGNVEETRIWNRALNQCEIINNKNCELDPSQKNGLVAYFKYNQGFVNADNAGITTLTDASDNHNNGTLQNFTLDGTVSNWSDFKINGTCAIFSLPPVTATSNGTVFGIGSTIKLFAAGGFSYTWDGPAGFSSTEQNPTITNAQINKSGTYTVTAPFVNCVVTASTRLAVSAIAPIRADGPTTFCPSGSVTLNSPIAGLSYQWLRDNVAITGATGSSYVATQAGSYTLSVVTTKDILVTEPLVITVEDNLAPEPVLANLPVLNLATPATVTDFPTALDNCAGLVTATTTSQLTYLDQGNFTIKWKYDDHNGHVVYQDQQVVVVIGRDVVPPVLTVPANITLPGDAAVCGAVANFAATATDNTTEPIVITYSKDPGTVFPVGTTTVTVTATDGGQNQTVGTFTVTVTPTVVAPITGTTTVCSGNRTALATASTGGTWSSADESIATVDASGTVTGIAGGTVVFTYTNACGVTASATITVLATPSVPVITVNDNCGTSNLSVSAGGSLLWSTNSTASSITVAAAGIYSVTRTINGCSSAPGSAIAAPKAVPAVPTVSASNSCGSSVLTASGTDLLWNTGEAVSSITVTAAGTYSVTQTVNGCASAAASVTAAPIAIPAAPLVSVVNNCANSVLSTNASGNLLWSTGETTSSITVTNDGTYTVTQTANGCTSAAGSGVAAPKGFPAAPAVTVADNCGKSTMTASGTNLVWSTGGTGTTLTVSSPGTYTVTQTVSGCTSAAAPAVAAPAAVPAKPVVTVSNECGSSLVSAEGTNLLWNTGATDFSFRVNVAATYTVTQTVNGCVSPAATVTTAPIAIPAAPVVSVTNNCANSVLSTNATGSLLWSTGQTSSSITVTNSGPYTVTQTVNGCTSLAGTGVASPRPNPAVPVVSVVDNCGNSVVSTNATGSLLWNNGSTASSFTVTANGNYSVTVTAPNNCTATSTVANVIIRAIPVVPAITGTLTTATGTSAQLANTTTGGSWTSSNPAVASVSAGGLVAGITIGTTTITYTVTSATGCAASVTALFTVVPNCVTPVLTAQADVPANTSATGCTAVVTYGTTVSVGSPAPTVTYLFTGATSGSGSGTGSGSVFNKGTTYVKVTATNSCGTAIRTFNVVVTDVTPPVVVPVAAQSACAGASSYTIPTLAATDNCGPVTTSFVITNAAGVVYRSGTGNNASGSFNTGVSRIKWTVADSSGNTVSLTTDVTVITVPVASITPASADNFCNRLYLNGASSVSGASYAWTYGTSVVGATPQLDLSLSNGDGNYQLTVTANGCTSAPVTYNFQKQNFAGSYTILVYDDATIGKYNKIASGSFGIMTATGDARFRTYSAVTGAGSFVKGLDIRKDWGATINTQIYGIATVTLPAMQYNTESTKYLSNYTASVNGIVNGNYKELTVKKNISVTVNGKTFGTIKLEEGASITFTQPVLDIDNLVVDNGAKNYTYSYVRFAPNSTVRVSTKVSLGREVILNPDSYKVTFFMGDLKCDNNEKFSVKGADTRVTANIIMPNGKLTVNAPDSDNDDHDACDHKAHYYWNCPHKGHDHDDCDHKAHSSASCNDDVYMTGLFVVEDLESKGNTVIWNSFDCGTAAPMVLNSKSAKQTGITQEASKLTAETAVAADEDLKVTVLPNPSTTYFTLKFASRFEIPVNLRVMDASGRVVDAKSKVGSNSTLQIGHNYSSGTYYAEVSQGGLRKVIQLIKAKG